MITVYASIGNSDDKLTQKRWSEFADLFATMIQVHPTTVHGVWYSRPDAPFQNACACFEIAGHDVPILRSELARLADEFDQDSIAWAVAQTEFIGPAS